MTPEEVKTLTLNIASRRQAEVIVKKIRRVVRVSTEYRFLMEVLQFIRDIEVGFVTDADFKERNRALDVLAYPILRKFHEAEKAENNKMERMAV